MGLRLPVRKIIIPAINTFNYTAYIVHGYLVTILTYSYRIMQIELCNLLVYNELWL
ncbi:MAG: hypothetical protein PWP10_2667 [Clostridiales bacterium]|nr:hypothetical protein [Clostridiales bacterium]